VLGVHLRAHDDHDVDHPQREQHGHDAADGAVAGVARDGAHVDRQRTAATAMPRIANTPPGEMKRKGFLMFGAPQYSSEMSAKAISRITGHFTHAQIGRKEPIRKSSSPWAPMVEAIGPSSPSTIVSLSSTETMISRMPRI